MFERGEHARQADGEDQRADHQHHGRQPEQPVVGVIGRGKPCEIDPRPADGEARQAEARERDAIMAGGERVGELRSGKAETQDESEVEQELERRRDAMRFMRIAAGHLPGMMVKARLGQRGLAHERNPSAAARLAKAGNLAPRAGGFSMHKDTHDGDHMRRSIIILGIAASTACLSACSDRARNETEEAGNAIASDIDNASDKAANAAQHATDSANAVIDRAGDRIDAAANKAEQKGEDAKRATGRALENAGEALQK